MPKDPAISTNETIGKMLRFHRRKAGLTQNALADLAGVGKTAVFDIENNKQTVQYDTLTKVLHALNIQIVFQSPLMDSYRKPPDEKS